MRIGTKRLTHWAGSALGLVGVMFVAFKLAEYGDQIDWSRFSPAVMLGLSGLVLAYGVANPLLAFAWRDLLRHFRVSVGMGWAFRAYGTSQLARYVPGNIFHLAGRQAIGQAAGLPGWQLAKSAVWELGMISGCGGLFVLLITPYLVVEVSEAEAVAMFVAAVGAAVLLARRWLGQRIARAVLWYVSFLALSGGIFLSVLSLIVPAASISGLPQVGICGAYVVAWLAGLLTPGAPAGVGVRELVLFTVLQGVVTQADLLTAVLVGRIVTVGGDVVFYFLAVATSNVRKQSLA